MDSPYLWVNLITTSTNDLTIDDGLYMGNHPLMAELFRLVKYYDLPRYLSSGLKGAIRSYGYSYSLSNEELRSYQEFPNHILDNYIYIYLE